MYDGYEKMARVEREIEKRMEAACEKALAYFGLTGRGDDGTKKWTGLVESPAVLLKLSPTLVHHVHSVTSHGKEST